MTNLTPEQIEAQNQANQMKQALLQGFDAIFKNLVEYLQKIQMTPNIQSFCFMNLDQGAFWARQGIAHMPLSSPVVPLSAPEEKLEKEELSA